MAPLGSAFHWRTSFAELANGFSESQVAQRNWTMPGWLGAINTWMMAPRELPSLALPTGLAMLAFAMGFSAEPEDGPHR
jgi:hypothetical protein